MRILEDVIDRELEELHKQGTRLRHIGRLDRLKPSLRQKVLDAIEYTKDNDRLTLCVAFNYGGRDEIVCAIEHMIEDGVNSDQVSVELVRDFSSDIVGLEAGWSGSGHFSFPFSERLLYSHSTPTYS